MKAWQHFCTITYHKYLVMKGCFRVGLYKQGLTHGLGGGGKLEGMKMPKKYVVEMVMDRIAASKVYMKESYNDASPLKYYERGKDVIIIHKESRELLEFLLQMLAEKGEKETFRYIKKYVLK